MKLTRAQLAAQAQFDRQAGNYGKKHLLADTSDLDEITRELPAPKAGDEALDVACGGGHASLFFARGGWKTVSCDLAPGMLEQTRLLLDGEGFEGEFLLSPAEELPFASERFGLLSCRVAAHHFQSVPAFLGEAFRVLRPGGWLVVIDGAAPDGSPVAEAWLHEVEKLRDPSHGRFLSTEAWQREIAAAGFVVRQASQTPLLQPDLEAYFNTADTPKANRLRVLELCRTAPDEVVRVMRLTNQEGLIQWWWPRAAVLARRPEGRD